VSKKETHPLALSIPPPLLVVPEPPNPLSSFPFLSAAADPQSFLGYTKRSAVYILQRKFREAERDLDMALQVSSREFLAQASLPE